MTSITVYKDVTVSEEVEISQNVDIEVTVESVACDCCSQELKFNVGTDSWGDLCITVEPHSCEE